MLGTWRQLQQPTTNTASSTTKPQEQGPEVKNITTTIILRHVACHGRLQQKGVIIPPTLSNYLGPLFCLVGFHLKTSVSKEEFETITVRGRRG